MRIEDEEVDRLSELPDDILHNILSFLPTKHVIQTCLLSKKWRNFWVSVPYLDFNIEDLTDSDDDDEEDYNMPSMSFVDRVLILRGSSPLQRLRLFCGPFCDPYRLKAWILTALWQDVRELDLFIDLEQEPCFDFELPSEIFTSSIRVFKLESSFPNFLLDIPRSILSASHLRVLELGMTVSLPPGDSKGELVFSCPVLEVLVLRNCVYDHLNVLSINTLQLKDLVLDNSENERGYLDLLADCKLELHTPKLSSFVYKGSMHVSNSLGDLSNLVNAEICMDVHVDVKKVEPLRAIEVLKGLCSVRNLALEGLEIFPKVPDALLELLTSYKNLRNLKLESCLDNAGVTRMAFLLSSCPSIETLVMQVTEMETSIEEHQKLMLPVECMLNHLKYIAIERLHGYSCEIELFLTFLLENAVALERMTITGSASKNVILILSQFFPSFDHIVYENL